MKENGQKLGEVDMTSYSIGTGKSLFDAANTVIGIDRAKPESEYTVVYDNNRNTVSTYQNGKLVKVEEIL